jgi:hypothetical protein
MFDIPATTLSRFIITTVHFDEWTHSSTLLLNA